MDFLQRFYSACLLISIMIAVFLIQYSYKRRCMPGARYFIGLLTAAGIYSATYLGELNSSTFTQAKMWFDLEHLVVPLHQYFWLMMGLDYVGIDKMHMKWIKYAAMYHPVLYYLVFYTNQYHHLYIVSYSFVSNGYFSVIITTKGILYAAAIISGTIMSLIATLFYLRGMIRSTAKLRPGYMIMLLASFIPWTTVYLIATNENYLGIDYFPIATVLSGLLYVYGIFRFRLFNTIPIASEQVFRQSQDAIILIDNLGRVIDANDSAKILYPELMKLAKDITIKSFILKNPELHKLMEGEEVTYNKAINSMNRYFSALLSDIMMEEKQSIGKIITIYDITQLHQYQLKLQKTAMEASDKAELNEISFLQAQIEPHFINNTLSTIASMITRAPEEAKRLITDLGDYLINCYYFDSTSDTVSLDKELKTIETYVNIEKARFRERLNFVLQCDDLLDIQIPKLVLQPLVENAIRHGILKKAEGGTVWLIIQKGGDRINFEVKDNGIGISEEIISMLTAGNQSSKGIGITNINRRLIKHYGDGLMIRRENPGTSVSFSISNYMSKTNETE